jgi:thiol-disulfide isomerase/thioredoxin
MSKSPALALVTTLGLGFLAPSQTNEQINTIIKELVARSHHATQYSWDGDLFIDVKQGESQWRPVSNSKVQCAIGKDGRSLLKIQPEGGEEYWLISNGKKSWAYKPAKKQYTEEESASRSVAEGGTQEKPEEGESGGTTEQRYARQLVPNIGEFLLNAQAMNRNPKPMNLKFEKEKVSWPAIQVTENPDQEGNKTIAELAVDPSRPVIGHMAWMESNKSSSGLVSLRVNVSMNSFSLGEDLPDSLFEFDPPKKAKLVEAMDVPGQELSQLLNRLTPDFEAKTIAGNEKVRISELHGKVVLLNFWASWCPPCRAELPTVAKLAAELKGQGLVVYGVNDEDPSTTRKYLEKQGLVLPTLDDGNEKAHHLYRVYSIPTVFLIDEQGHIVKYLKGGHDEDSLRAAIKSVGVGN